jgi:hypothetical protein
MALVWEFARDDHLGHVAQSAMDGTVPPSFHGEVVASTGDTITLRVVSGTPSRNPRLMVYVERRGTFELVRREEWPPADDGRPRVQLTLRAWPNRERHA